MTDAQKLKAAQENTTFEFGIAVHCKGMIMFYSEGRHIVKWTGDNFIYILSEDLKTLGMIHEDEIVAINRIPQRLPEDVGSLPNNSFVQ